MKNFVRRNMLLKWLCMSSFMVSYHALVAMDEPFFVKKSDDLDTQRMREDLKSHLGFNKSSPKIYAMRIQRFASGLYEQEHFFMTFNDYAKAKDSIEALANERNKIPEDALKMNLSLENTVFRSREAYIVSLIYQELFLCTTFSPNFKIAIDNLAKSTNSEVILLRRLLQLQLNLIEEVPKYHKLESLFNKVCERVASLDYLNDLSKTAADVYIKTFLEPLLPIESVGEMVRYQAEKRQEALEVYSASRSKCKKYYALAIQELNTLLNKKLITRSLCLILKSDKLLPGIEVDEASLPSVAGPSNQETMSLEDLLEQNWVKESLPASKTEKGKEKKGIKKKKTGTNVVQNTKSETVSSPSKKSTEEKESPQDEPVSLDTCPTGVVLSDVSTDIVLTYSVESNDFVCVWSLYKISHKNTIKFPRFPLTYSKNVLDWKENPENALRLQGYYDSSSNKYKRAFAFAEYAGGKEMRTYMSIYHNFPNEIDEQIKNYGRVEMKMVKAVRDSKLVDEPRIVITMAGELEVKDHIKRGLFCYIIDPAKNVCYHRMFEPVEKSPLKANFYDIYFMSAD